jgi:F-type H+-transporting ATPase subunit epsilon
MPIHALICNIISPERILYQQEVDFIALPLEEGEIGVLPDHAPLVARIGYGIVRVKQNGGENWFAVNGGFVEIKGNEANLMVSYAVQKDEINLEAVRQEVQELKGKDLGDQFNLNRLNWLNTQIRLAEAG